MNEFSAIGVALSGMNASSEELDVTSNNIANQSTPGYVRESAKVAAAAPATPSLQAPSDGIGQGVLVLGITRNADVYLDSQDLSAHANAAGLSETQAVLSQTQGAFNEPSSTGIAEQLASFWSEWDAVASTPTDSSARATLIAQASGLATSFNQASTALSQVRTGAAQQGMTDVSEINQDAAAIASLNLQIVNAVAGGGSSGGLADQRDALITKLAQLAGVTARPEANGAMDLNIGSQTLVSGMTATTLAGTVSANGNLSVTWPNGTTVAAGGQLGALVQAVNTTIPGYQAQLDNAAATLATTVNNQLAAGVSWSGATSTPGVPLFTGTSAATLAVSSTITPAQLAAGAPSAGPADGSNAQTIATLGAAPNGADTLYRALIGQIGTDVSTVTTQATAAATVQSNTDAARQSSEGVNLDEELANMTQFQNSYAANAKVMGAIDQTIQSLLSMVG